MKDALSVHFAGLRTTGGADMYEKKATEKDKGARRLWHEPPI